MSGTTGEEYYNPNEIVGGEQNRFLKWLRLVFRKRKVVYVGCFALVAIACWILGNWFPLVFYLVVLVAVTRIFKLFNKTGRTFVIECRIQGEIIKHCTFFGAPIKVPSSWLRIHVLPHSRLKDVRRYGDDTPPVTTTNITVVDYYEEVPTGEIIMVYPQDSNFSNFALMSRMNPDIVESMKEIGRKRLANEDFKAVAVEMFHAGKLGATPQAAAGRLRDLMLDYNAVESKLANSPAAMRAVWLFYKDTIPEMQKHLHILNQELPRKAMSIAAKFAQQSFGHPFGRETAEQIEELTNRSDPLRFEAKVKRTEALDDGDALQNRKLALPEGSLKVAR